MKVEIRSLHVHCNSAFYRVRPIDSKTSAAHRPRTVEKTSLHKFRGRNRQLIAPLPARLESKGRNINCSRTAARDLRPLIHLWREIHVEIREMIGSRS